MHLTVIPWILHYQGQGNTFMTLTQNCKESTTGRLEQNGWHSAEILKYNFLIDNWFILIQIWLNF